MHVDLPGERLVINRREFMLRTLANTPTIEDFKNFTFPLSKGGYLQLSGIADITDGGAEWRSLSRMDGRPVVGFSVFRTKEASEVDVSQKVEQQLKKLTIEETGLYIERIFCLADFTEMLLKTALYAFLEGALLTVAVVFFKNHTSHFNCSDYDSFIYYSNICSDVLVGINLNNASLLAISLVTGVLVDDAIVEIENIHRHIIQGRKPYETSMVAADEIGLAVVAITSVICAVFIPVGFMPGITGRFFSLMVAPLITPMMCAYFLKDKSTATKPSKILPFYKRLVEWTLSHRAITLTIAAFCLVGSFNLIPFRSIGFIPLEDHSQSIIKLELPYGSTLERTDAVAQQIAERSKKYTEVKYVLTTVNGGITGSQGPHQAAINIKLVAPDKRKIDQRSFDNQILTKLKDIPDVKINVA